jgi:phosphate transport system substrate-binding protein
LRIVAATVLLLAVAAGCGKGGGGIYLITREESSGTRSAFITLFGLEIPDEQGRRIDHTLATAEITKDTSVMLMSVAGDPEAIGYVSLGSLSGSVKALKIDGVAPGVAAIRSGAYAVVRPFNIITGSAATSPAAQAFVAFILSAEGQAVVEAAGYVPLAEPSPQGSATAKLTGRVVVGGSSSVTPLMEKLQEAFVEKYPGIEVDVNQSDSTIGVSDAVTGRCDIGMSSRALQPSEIARGARETTIATDGVVVIVSHANPVNDLTKEQVRQIYSGEITAWADVEVGA